MNGGCRVNTWNPMSVSVLLILLVSTFYNLTNILINNVYVIMLIVNINLAALHFWNIYCCKLRAYFLETGFQGDIWRQIKFITLSSFFCFVFCFELLLLLVGFLQFIAFPFFGQHELYTAPEHWKKNRYHTKVPYYCNDFAVNLVVFPVIWILPSVKQIVSPSKITQLERPEKIH